MCGDALDMHWSEVRGPGAHVQPLCVLCTDRACVASWNDPWFGLSRPPSPSNPQSPSSASTRPSFAEIVYTAISGDDCRCWGRSVSEALATTVDGVYDWLGRALDSVKDPAVLSVLLQACDLPPDSSADEVERAKTAFKQSVNFRNQQWGGTDEMMLLSYSFNGDIAFRTLTLHHGQARWQTVHYGSGATVKSAARVKPTHEIVLHHCSFSGERTDAPNHWNLLGYRVQKGQAPLFPYPINGEEVADAAARHSALVRCVLEWEDQHLPRTNDSPAAAGDAAARSEAAAQVPDIIDVRGDGSVHVQSGAPAGTHDEHVMVGSDEAMADDCGAAAAAAANAEAPARTTPLPATVYTPSSDQAENDEKTAPSGATRTVPPRMRNPIAPAPSSPGAVPASAAAASGVSAGIHAPSRYALVGGDDEHGVGEADEAMADDYGAAAAAAANAEAAAVGDDAFKTVFHERITPLPATFACPMSDATRRHIAAHVRRGEKADFHNTVRQTNKYLVATHLVSPRLLRAALVYGSRPQPRPLISLLSRLRFMAVQGYTPATDGRVTRPSRETYFIEGRKKAEVGGMEVLFHFTEQNGGAVRRVWVHERHLDWEGDWQMLHWHLVHGTWGCQLIKVQRLDPDGKVAVVVQCQCCGKGWEHLHRVSAGCTLRRPALIFCVSLPGFVVCVCVCVCGQRSSCQCRRSRSSTRWRASARR